MMHLFALSIAFASAAVAVVAGPPVQNWSYEGATGPARWASLSPEYSTCGKGQQQSPINIKSGRTRHYGVGERGAPQLELRWAELSQVTGKHNGHTVQVDVPEARTEQQQQVIYQNTTYSMQQFHLHTPSEHRVNGHFYAGEIHFVHKSAEGKLLVIGAFLDVKSHVDSDRAIFQPLTRQLPIKAGEQTRPFTMDLSRVKRLTDGPNGFWTYDGSLTTPPCTEGVTWIVLDMQLPLSLAQLTTIKESIRFSARYTMQ